MSCDFTFEQALGGNRASEECLSNCKDLGYIDYSLQTCMYGGAPVYCCRCYCISDSDCLEGYVCENGECVKSTIAACSEYPCRAVVETTDVSEALPECIEVCGREGYESASAIHCTTPSGELACCCVCYCLSDAQSNRGYVCENGECVPAPLCEDLDCDFVMGGTGTQEEFEMSCSANCRFNTISKKYTLTRCDSSEAKTLSPNYCCDCICESDSDCYSNAPYCINNECQACTRERFCEDRGYDCCLAELGADTYGGRCVNRGYITSDGKWLCVP